MYDGDTCDGDDGSGYANCHNDDYVGCCVVNARSKDAPRIVDKYGRTILDHSEIYNGVYARVSLSFYVYSIGNEKRIACCLGNIQKTYDCDVLSGLPVEPPVTEGGPESEHNKSRQGEKIQCQAGSKSQKWTNQGNSLSNYFQIPRTIIEAKHLGNMRTTVFSVLQNCKGLDDRVTMNALDIAEYTKLKEDTCNIGVKFEKVQNLLDAFESEGYIRPDAYGVNESHASYLFNSKRVREDECEYGCGYICTDEMMRVLKYNIEDENKCYDPDNALLLLAYLKMNIGPQIDKTEEYAAYYGDLADILGISVSAVSDAADALREMGLVNFTRAKSFMTKGYCFTRKRLLKEDWATVED